MPMYQWLAAGVLTHKRFDIMSPRLVRETTPIQACKHQYQYNTHQLVNNKWIAHMILGHFITPAAAGHFINHITIFDRYQNHQSVLLYMRMERTSNEQRRRQKQNTLRWNCYNGNRHTLRTRGSSLNHTHQNIGKCMKSEWETNNKREQKHTKKEGIAEQSQKLWSPHELNVSFHSSVCFSRETGDEQQDTERERKKKRNNVSFFIIALPIGWCVYYLFVYKCICACAPEEEHTNYATLL